MYNILWLIISIGKGVYVSKINYTSVYVTSIGPAQLESIVISFESNTYRRTKTGAAVDVLFTSPRQSRTKQARKMGEEEPGLL